MGAPAEVHTGSCLCGGVQFRIEGGLAPIEICHCGQCRKAQGTPFATNIPLRRTALEIVAGADLLTEYESSPGKKRVFCRRCGSPLFSRRDALPEMIRLRAGCLNEPLAVRPVAHAHVASKCNWWTVDDELPQYAAAYRPGEPPDF